MKTIKLFLLVPILALASYGYSATLTISGNVTDNGVGKSGVLVIWTDSATFNTDSTLTDSMGNYSLTLNTGSATQGQAWGIITDCKGKQDWAHIYYSPRSTSYPNQNFVYCTTPPPPGASTVSGAVYTGNTLAVKAIVLLILKDSGRLTSVDTSTVLRGRYSFTLPDSTKQYLVKAILLASDPNYSSYLPTYGDSSLNWSGAKLIPTGGNKTYNRFISLKKGRNTGGAGFIGGLVSRGANKSLAVGDPIEGAQVMLLQNNEPVVYTYSNSNGEFSFDNLDNGTYTVYTEILGLPTVTVDVTISSSNSKEEGVRVSVNSSGATTTITATSIETYGVFAELKAFPNPVQNNFTIQFGTEVKTGSISVLDNTGKVIETMEINNQNEVNLSFNNYLSGTYLIRISDTNDNSVIRVVKQ